MQNVTLEDLQAYIAKTGDFRPFVQSHAELAERLLEPENDATTAWTRPTMFSTKLADRLHFRDGEVTAWAGYNGHRKSMFLGQVVADLLVQKRRVFVLSMEMTPIVTLRRIARQMSGTAQPSKAWVDKFAAWSRSLYMLNYAGRIDPALCMAACRWAADQMLSPHIVIDSLMMVVGSEEHLDEQKQFVTDIVRFAAETGAHIHLVAHCRKPARDGEDEPPTKYELRGSAAISDQCHNVVTVWANKPKQRALEKNLADTVAMQEPDAMVTVEKQRNGQWEGRVKLWFDHASLRFCNDRVSRVEPYHLGE